VDICKCLRLGWIISWHSVITRGQDRSIAWLIAWFLIHGGIWSTIYARFAYTCASGKRVTEFVYMFYNSCYSCGNSNRHPSCRLMRITPTCDRRKEISWNVHRFMRRYYWLSEKFLRFCDSWRGWKLKMLLIWLRS